MARVAVLCALIGVEGARADNKSSVYGACSAACAEGRYSVGKALLTPGPLELALARSGRLGPWLPELHYCPKGDVSTCERVPAALRCEEVLKYIHVTTILDRFGHAVADVTPVNAVELARCFGVAPENVVIRLAAVEGLPRSALEACNTEPCQTNLVEPRTDRVIPGATYGVYVGRRGGDAFVYATTVILGAGETDLQALFSRATDPWLVADWTSGSLRLVIHRQAVTAEAMAELRLATVQGYAWIETGDDQRWPLHASLETDELLLSDAAYHHLRRSRWGSDADRLVPTEAEWRSFFEEALLCVARTYAAREEGRCRRLADLTRWPARGTVRLRLRRVVRDVRTNDAFTLRERIISETSAIITTADQFSLEMIDIAEKEHLHWCAERCMPVGVTAHLHGLVELRITTEHGDQGLTLLRLWVMDPRSDWRPFRHDGSWTRVERDVDGFAFRKQGRELITHVDVPSTVGNAWRAIGQPITPTLAPRLGDVAALFTAVSFDGRCPDVRREGNAPVPSARLVDQSLYLHLIVRSADDTECIAQASFAIWEARSRAVASAARVVVLGDSQVTIDPVAPSSSLMFPVLSALSRAVGGVRLEVSTGATITRTFGDQLSAGAALWSGVQFGVPHAPRLFTAGVAGAVLLSGDTVLSTYVGINVGVLYDLAGGR